MCRFIFDMSSYTLYSFRFPFNKINNQFPYIILQAPRLKYSHRGDE